ncbi:conserved hypothetical protein [Histoplasma mississippiense (nom. inval.)]|uniref:conserved hypothetical protein n=1 Tax=Ajellomyces capsulatus (strain NAm1 / WU24) TaxID=2059318 RepID=UPI000157C791|nr:conserved hypothetical protein [Histoplasma mississippiense (nom. inval.)]EDN08436.1 conserved hypothetical protein [Histoplasma mississippiense (nom. inval.)]
MVRLKHRYLLVDILYPPASVDATTPAKSKHTHSIPNNAKDIHLLIHRPTTDTLTPQSLARAVREHVAEMFGDWGMGRLGGNSAGGVSGTEIPFPRNIHGYNPLSSRELQTCLRQAWRDAK